MPAYTCLRAAAACIAVWFFLPPAHAAAYRCVLAGGHVSYQQIPCQYGSEPMEFTDQRIGGSSLRPGERKLLNSYLDKDAVRGRKASGAPKEPGPETRSCWRKRRQLQAVRSKLRRGYTLKESDALHRKRDDYEDYLRHFCP